jgi:predicted nucleic acid-binding protein
MVAAVRSPRGASARLLRAVREGRVTLVANPALFLEYEAVLKRAEHLAAAGLRPDDVDVLLKALAAMIAPAGAGLTGRPMLTDPDDEFVLEAAIHGRASAIVTFETKTFTLSAQAFGIEVLTLGAMWSRLK